MTYSVSLMPALISAVFALSSAFPAQASEFVHPVKLKVPKRSDCKSRNMGPYAARDAIKGKAIREFGATDEKAEALASRWRTFVDNSPRVEDKPRYSNGICNASYFLVINDEAIEAEMNRSAYCRRPAAILTRVNMSGREESSETLSLQAHQYMLDAFNLRGFAVVDVSEQTDQFRNTIRQADSCAYVGGDPACEERKFTLSESILGILRNTNLIIRYYDDENIDGDKYLPLARDGVLNFISMEVAPERSRVAVTATINSYRIANRDIAWAVPPQTQSVPTRRFTTEEAARKAFSDIAKKMALESARRCNQSKF